MDRPTNDADQSLDVLASPAPVPPAVPASVDLFVASLPVDHSGTTVHIQGWRCLDSQRHPLLIVHDLGEHSDHYRTAAEAFVGAGYSVYVFDLRGHGRSGRRLGHAPSFAILVKDLLQVAAWVRHQEDGREPVILGQGVGALILVDFTKHYGALCKAAILSAPCFELATELPTPSRMLLKLLADALPLVRLPAAFSPRFSRDTKAAGKRGDGKIADMPRVTAVFAHELLMAIKRAEARFIEYHGSVLILCPEQDSVCLYHQMKRSAALHNEHNLLIVDLPDTTHAVFTGRDPARVAAMAVILPWLERTLHGSLEVEPARDAPRRGAAAREAKPGATKA